MGIRIHKNLCYALPDVKVKDYRIVDPRFQSWIRDPDDELYERPRRMFIPFLEWIMDPSKSQEIIDLLAIANGPSESDIFGLSFGITQQAKEFFKLSEEERQSQLDKLFHVNFIHQPEYGLPKIFAIIPPEHPDWARYDNLIDYYDNQGIPRDRVRWLDHHCGIYPHNMMLRKPHMPSIRLADSTKDCELPYSPERQKRQPDPRLLPDRLFGGEYNRIVGKYSPKLPALVAPEMVKQMGKTYRCDIYTSVLLWTHYVGLFNDWAKTVNELRPCIYTYWS